MAVDRKEVFKYLENLGRGKHSLSNMVRKDNKEEFIEICKEYIDEHPDTYFNSTYTSIIKIRIPEPEPEEKEKKK